MIWQRETDGESLCDYMEQQTLSYKGGARLHLDYDHLRTHKDNSLHYISLYKFIYISF